ncbi:30S ribosomal protein S6 [Candidatus Nomurabacteria bacterium]|nr:30S ribosomal protein S6 [Candidatus Nomurabacteria bacterium]
MTTVPKNDELKTYELGYLLSPLVSSEQVGQTVEKDVKSLLKKAGAEVKSEIQARHRGLAYPIKKVVEHKGSIFREAYFGAIVFTCAPENIPALEEGLKKSLVLIRHLLIVLPPGALLVPAKPRVVQVEGDSPEVAESVPKVEAKMTEAAIDKEIEDLIHVS